MSFFFFDDDTAKPFEKALECLKLGEWVKFSKEKQAGPSKVFQNGKVPFFEHCSLVCVFSPECQNKMLKLNWSVTVTHW